MINEAAIKAAAKYPYIAIIAALLFGLYFQHLSNGSALDSQRVAADKRMQNQRETNNRRLEDQREAADGRVKLYIELTSAQNAALTELYKRDHELYLKILSSMAEKQNRLLAGQAAFAAKGVLFLPGDEPEIKAMIQRAKNAKN